MIENLFFSNKYCLLCLENKTNSYICENCLNRLEYIDGEKELENGICIYPLFYNNFIKEIIHKLKYEKKSYIFKAINEILYNYIKFKKIDFDYISYVPMYHQDEFERGYNQSKLMAEFLSKSLDKPLIDLASKVNSTKNQNKLHKNQRILNLKNSFQVNLNLKIENKKVLIVDDLVTTGSTFNTLSDEIKKIYKLNFIFLALASSQIDEI